MPLKSRYNATFTGDVKYGNKVLMSIIELAVRETSGVAKLDGKQIAAEIANGFIKADIFIVVKSGVNCTDVAFRVQENIKRSIETMTEYKTGTINIHILGIVDTLEEEKEPFRL